jgi:hypothetical protein
MPKDYEHYCNDSEKQASNYQQKEKVEYLEHVINRAGLNAQILRIYDRFYDFEVITEDIFVIM